jgi:ABC-type multidrug transport system fused ATPase/permease subunit
MKFNEINWPGLGCSITAAILVALSVIYAAPWWQVAVGDGVGQAEISPLDYKANLAGASLELPIIWFLNLGSKLTMAACAVAMFIYSVSTQKPFCKQLLGFAYKKPLLILALFIIMLVVSTYIVGTFFGVNIPLMGTTTVSLSFGGTTANIPVSTSLTWVFWLAVLTAVLAIAAKIYEWKVLKTPSVQTHKYKAETTIEKTNLKRT